MTKRQSMRKAGTLAELEVMQSVLIKAPIERVWEEVTKVGQLNRALMDSVFDTTLEPGAPVTYRTKDGKRVFIVGRILEVEAPRRLVMRWQLTMRKDPPSRVTWTLEPEDGGTRVTVFHDDFAEGTKMKGYSTTWVEMLSNLKHVIEEGDLALGVKVKYGMMGLMQFALPASIKADRVTIPD